MSGAFKKSSPALWVFGAGGRMGASVMALSAREGFDLQGGVSRHENHRSEFPVYTMHTLPERLRVDLVIDFSSPEGMREAGQFALEHKAAFLSGTTGLSPEDEAVLDHLSQEIPVLHARNTSAAVHVLAYLVAEAARLLPNAHVEIIETHHKDKRDAPSGTALMLREAAIPVESAGAAPAVPIHSVRGGQVIGEHQVSFMLDDERVELTHKADTRLLFARGALRMAHFLVTQKEGRYSAIDWLGSLSQSR